MAKKKAPPKKAAEKTETDTETQTEDVPYSFMSPESETIMGATFDPTTLMLTITFRFNGSTYHYGSFPTVMWREFLEATSKGRYFQSRIRPLFAGKKVA